MEKLVTHCNLVTFERLCEALHSLRRNSLSGISTVFVRKTSIGRKTNAFKVLQNLVITLQNKDRVGLNYMY